MTDSILDMPRNRLATRHRRWLPFGDRPRARRLVKVLAWLAGIALALAVLEGLGVDVLGWFSDLWDALSSIGLGYLLALPSLGAWLAKLGVIAVFLTGYGSP